ncbi:MAG: DUF5716 family protein [Lachnospiraceae bacterium]|nr:DUF5716 family protein [Lachnospiraceae bacterium]
MQNLFDVIPAGFFNYLASNSNHRIYADCLQIIYHEYDREISYRIPRSRVRDTLAIYLMENHVRMEDENFPESKNYNDMAGAVIRRLSDPNVGWLEEEADDVTYEKHIVMTEAGIRLAEFLTELIKPEKEEFSGYIYSIYNTLQNEEMWKQDPYIDVLLPVNRNARMLSKALKRLSTFIRKIIERMVNEGTFESLTENIIEYCEGSFIKEYTRLTKQQNIHVYRGIIRKQLDRLQEDEDIMERLVTGCMAEEEIPRREAEEQVLILIQSARRFLTDDYDRIMKDIKHKINIYLHVAVGRMRFIYNRGTDIRGSVEHTIKYMIEEMRDIGMKDEMPQDMNGLFLLDRNEFIDMASLRYPRKQRQIAKVTAAEIEEMTQEQIDEARRAQKKEAYNPYSREKMKRYVEQLMGERETLDSEEIPLRSKNDILASLSAVAYSGENGYVVEPGEGYTQTDQMILRNFTIRKDKG